MIIAIGIILIILSILLINIKACVYLDVDAVGNIGNIEVKVFCFKVLRQEFFFDFNCFEFVFESKKEASKSGTRECRKNKKITEKNSKLKNKASPKKISEIFKHQIVKQLNFSEIRARIEVGTNTDVLMTVYGFSITRILFSAFSSILNAKLGTKVRSLFVPNFAKSSFSIQLVAKIELRVFSLLYGIIVSLLQKLRKKRRKKNGVQRGMLWRKTSRKGDG